MQKNMQDIKQRQEENQEEDFQHKIGNIET